MRRKNSPKINAGFGVALVMLLLGMSSLSAQGAASISQGFKTDDPNVIAGTIVSLEGDTPNTVELSTLDNVDKMHGVAGEDALIELSDGKATVKVVTAGETLTLVSDINGQIKTGDMITASPIAGVGMKVTNSTTVIGTAQADLASVESETRTIKDKDGKEQSFKVGAIPIQVDKVFYESPQDIINNFLPPALQEFAANVAGRKVSPVRVMVAGILAVLLFVVVTVLLYSAVRSAIISIGRNPLSGASVEKGLLEVGLTIVGVLVFTGIIIYLILVT